MTGGSLPGSVTFATAYLDTDLMVERVMVFFSFVFKTHLDLFSQSTLWVSNTGKWQVL